MIAKIIFILFIKLLGPFELKGATFVCSNCNHAKDADASNYISSGLWPGDPLNISYLMDSSVYRFFYLLKHNIPSTSEMKVVQCLQEMSEGTGREVLFNLRYFIFPSLLILVY